MPGRAPALQTVKTLLGRFYLGDFNLNDPADLQTPTKTPCLPSGRMNELPILTGENSKSLEIDITTAFRHLKRITFKKKGQFWQIEKSVIFHYGKTRTYVARQIL